MMEINGLFVCQQGQAYSIYTPQGIQIAHIWMGQDGQVAFDVATLAPICKTLAKRWGINNNKKAN